MPKLERMHFAGATYLVNQDAGYFPYFQFILRNRIRQKKAVNVICTGEAGDGKSYETMTLCRLLNRKFTVNHICYTYAGYMPLLRNLPLGHPIMFDEPSYAMGKRDWFKQVNKILVQTLESQRFKVKPLFIPIINQSLLDKTIRTFLIQFQIMMIGRGRAEVYRIQASQYEDDKIYRHFVCELQYPLVDRCPKEYFKGKNKDSCLGCGKLSKCPTFRAQYERKKASIQDKRYAQAAEEAEYYETKTLTDTQIENILFSIRGKFLNKKGGIDIDLFKIVAREDCGITLGHNRAYRIAKGMVYHHPKDFK